VNDDLDTVAADYVVVGAGSAGCVVAARLSETGARVLLLEAGPADRHPMIHVPGLVVGLMHYPPLNWSYQSEPDPGIAGRSLKWPRGRVVGGSGSINGMNFVRGNPADFDGWAQQGARGWSYADVLPHFRAIERYAGGDPAFRGQEGPLVVEPYRTVLPLVRSFVKAAVEAGFPFTPDINGERQEGVGYSQMNRTRWRQSTARAFLAPALRRTNLRLETGATATRVVLDGRRATGVLFRQGDRERRAAAARGVVLCGGAINTPHLMQISGIGPAGHLKSIGVEVVHDLPVGHGLLDHYQARIVQRVKGAATINSLSRFPRVTWEALRWLVAGDGLFTFGNTQASVFCRSREGLASPDLQLMFTPGSLDPRRFPELEREPGLTLTVCVGRPDSRGTVLARSPDPLQPPELVANYLSAATDRDALARGLEIARRILAAPALAPFAVAETAPGPEVAGEEALLQYARETGGSVYHQAGTCRMGEDPGAVVDSRLRVHGIDGLRVIDASVMPTLTVGNIQAPVIMIAEKGAAMVREDERGADPGPQPASSTEAT
jgi:choline dehydrogenase